MYNPNIHHRRSIRLKGYDYSQAGLYCVTICVQDRRCLFGNIVDGEMILNEYGKIAFDEWVKLSERFDNVILDVFQIMPNHIHGIIALVGATLAVAQNDDDRRGNPRGCPDNGGCPNCGCPYPDNIPNDLAVVENGAGAVENGAGVVENRAEAVENRAGASPAPTVGNIVGAYKSLVVNDCLNIFKSKNEYMGKLWQRNYYEHIIRDDDDYARIAEYIENNPRNWNTDKFYIQ